MNGPRVQPRQVIENLKTRGNVVGLITRLGALLCLGAALSFAGSWSGFLVDSKCYESEQSNINPFDGSTYVDYDRALQIRTCRPTAHTKSFALVKQEDGVSVKLDPAGNAKAADLVRQAGKKSHDKKSYFVVTVTGEMSKDTVKVDSISRVR